VSFNIGFSFILLNSIAAEVTQDELDFISIMTDPDLHPLPITPNDPLSIVSINKVKNMLIFDHDIVFE
jgi:hypothetical protein